MSGANSERPRLAVYTAITAAKDTLKEPLCTPPGVDFYFFSDGSVPVREPWTLVPLDQPGLSPRRLSRWPKLLAHEALPDHEYSLWLDGSWTLCGDPFELVRMVLEHQDLALHRHPHRTCVYEEAMACIEKAKDSAEAIERQMQAYRDEGLPKAHGLMQASTILRRHTPRVAEFNRAWWRAYLEGSQRDQLSFGYAAWKMGMSWSWLPGSHLDTPWYWGSHRHRPDR